MINIQDHSNSIYSLVHPSSKDALEKLISKAQDKSSDREDRQKHIAILQNVKDPPPNPSNNLGVRGRRRGISTQNTSQDSNGDDIASLILTDSLVYYLARASTGNWKSGH